MNAIDMTGVNMALGNCGIAAGTTTTLTCTTAIPVAIDGKVQTMPTITNVQPAATDYNTGIAPKGIMPGFGTVIVFGTTSANSSTLQYCLGETVPVPLNAAAFTPGPFVDIPEFPEILDGFVPIGYALLRVGTDYTAGTPFVFGTSGTTATGGHTTAATSFTITYQPICTLPNRPQIV